MPPSFLVLSRANAAVYEPRGTEVCISITDPGDVPIPLSPKFKAVLRLAFSDIGEATRLHRTGDRLFAAEHVTETLDFISRWRDVDQVVIHCTAGRSSSPGLSLGICQLRSWPAEELQRRHPSANRWVQKEFVRVGREIAWPLNGSVRSNDPVRRLQDPSRLWARSEVLSPRSPVPPTRGLHGWFFDGVPKCVPVENCVVHDGLTLLYVGIAPSRASSSATLRSRIRQHYQSNAAGSTLRLTLGCLLAEQLRIQLQRTGSTDRLTFGKRGEEQLSEWMAANAFVCWVEHKDPWKITYEAVSALRPPLNEDENDAHPFCAALSALRSEMRKKAKE